MVKVDKTMVEDREVDLVLAVWINISLTSEECKSEMREAKHVDPSTCLVIHAILLG